MPELVFCVLSIIGLTLPVKTVTIKTIIKIKNKTIYFCRWIQFINAKITMLLIALTNTPQNNGNRGGAVYS